MSHPLKNFAGVRVLVIGDAMLDVYLSGRADRVCPEASAPIVSVTRYQQRAGGAANTAANLLALGAQVTLLSVVGDDREGASLRTVLAEAGAPVDALQESAGRSTLTKQRILVDGRIILRVDHGSTEALDGSAERRFLDALRARYAESDAIVISDYGYGVMTPTVIQEIGELRCGQPRLMTVDTKDFVRYRRLGVDLAKPNAVQALSLLGEPGTPSDCRVDQLSYASGRILEMTGARIAAVTLDRDGALVLDRAHPPYRVYARSTARPQPAGAGDTFLSTMTLALATGWDPPTAAELACAAAGIAVSKDGTAVCTSAELSGALNLDSIPGAVGPSARGRLDGRHWTSPWGPVPEPVASQSAATRAGGVAVKQGRAGI